MSVWLGPEVAVEGPNIREVVGGSTVACTQPSPGWVARVEAAAASQVAGAPPVFWMVLPVTVTFTALVHTTAWQLGAMVGVTVGVAVALDPRLPPQMYTLVMRPSELLIAVSTRSG